MSNPALCVVTGDLVYSPTEDKSAFNVKACAIPTGVPVRIAAGCNMRVVGDLVLTEPLTVENNGSLFVTGSLHVDTVHLYGSVFAHGSIFARTVAGALSAEVLSNASIASNALIRVDESVSLISGAVKAARVEIGGSLCCRVLQVFVNKKVKFNVLVGGNAVILATCSIDSSMSVGGDLTTGGLHARGCLDVGRNYVSHGDSVVSVDLHVGRSAVFYMTSTVEGDMVVRGSLVAFGSVQARGNITVVEGVSSLGAIGTRQRLVVYRGSFVASKVYAAWGLYVQGEPYTKFLHMCNVAITPFCKPARCGES